MNKKIIIALIMVILIVVIATVVLIKLKPSTNLKVNSVEDLKTLINQIYDGVTIELPTMETRELDLAEDWIIQPFTGLEDGSDLEYAVASETKTITCAYSLVLAKVKEGVNVEDIAKTMNENINPNKWVHETAEKVYTTTSGNVICLVMASEEEAKTIYESFKTLAGDIGQEYEKTADI